MKYSVFFFMQMSQADAMANEDQYSEVLQCNKTGNIKFPFSEYTTLNHSRKYGSKKNRCDALKAHSEKYAGRIFRCHHCDYTTTQSYQLKGHSRKHTGEMIQCQHCDYTTTQSGNLKRHSRKHTGEMFQCQHCDYTTIQSGNLKRHSRKHAGD